MRHLTVGLIAAWLALGGGGAEGAGKLRVVASLPDLGALTEAVGGDLVEVDVLARGDQNPHDIEIRPSLMVKLRRADLLVRNGVDGDPWVEPLVRGAGNARLAPGAPGHVDVSQGIQVLGVPVGPVDRSRGDVHPLGNPHFTLDPGNAAVVTANILEGLARLAPEHRAMFETRRREWLAHLDAAIRRWESVTRAVPGGPGRDVRRHLDLLPRPLRLRLRRHGRGSSRHPALARHVADLVRRMKSEQVRVVIYEPWADRKLIDPHHTRDWSAGRSAWPPRSAPRRRRPPTSTCSSSTCAPWRRRCAEGNAPDAGGRQRPARPDVGAVPDAPGPDGDPCLPRHPRDRAGGGVRRHRAGSDRGPGGDGGLPGGGSMREDLGSYWFGLAATIVGALVLALTRSRTRRVSQEAIIGVVYAVSSAAAVLLADRSPHGAEHLRTMLVGSILAVRLTDVVTVASLYAAVGGFHWFCRRPFFLISMDPAAAFREGWRVRLWDFLFYASFGVVVASSVRVAGVLLVSRT